MSSSGSTSKFKEVCIFTEKEMTKYNGNDLGWGTQLEAAYFRLRSIIQLYTTSLTTVCNSYWVFEPNCNLLKSLPINTNGFLLYV